MGPYVPPVPPQGGSPCVYGLSPFTMSLAPASPVMPMSETQPVSGIPLIDDRMYAWRNASPTENVAIIKKYSFCPSPSSRNLIPSSSRHMFLAKISELIMGVDR